MIRRSIPVVLALLLAATVLSPSLSARQTSRTQVTPARVFNTLQSQGAWQVPNPPAFPGFGTLPDSDGVIRTYVIFVEKTQALEAFTIYVPNVPAGQRVPLLTAFHAYGVGWLGIQHFSDLLPEVIQRGWCLVAPWQRNTAASANESFASAQSQFHVDAVLDFVVPRNPIDRDRIYGVGFSMGGGNALSYAARHRDGRHGAIAAVVNHTGTAALSHVYDNVDVRAQEIMELTFGGTPQAVPFEYQRSSVIELDTTGALMAGGRHVALNLESVPVQCWYNTNDWNVYLRDQTQALDSFLSQLPTSTHEIHAVTTMVNNCFHQHCWDTLDRTLALNWLSGFTLNDNPTSGTVLTDRSVRWGQFDVEQAQPGAFTSFKFEVLASGNALQLEAPENLTDVAMDVWAVGLRSDQSLAAKLRGEPGQPMVVRLTGWPVAPSVVDRNGIVTPSTCGATGTRSRWCYDPATQSILITEADLGWASWQILP